MAITALDYLVFSSLRQHNVFPARPRIFELGESNWYGDVPVEQFYADIGRAVVDPARRAELQIRLLDAIGVPREASSAPPAMAPADLNVRLAALPEAAASRAHYAIARIFFATFADCASYDANDPGTPGSKYRFDLNLPVPLQERFDVVVNIGTGEHVFNVHQFYKTAHDLTAAGGLMIHTAPCNGWPNHGFYNFQPTFFFDLARSNNYELLVMVLGRVQPFQYVQVQSQDQVVALMAENKVPDQSMIAVVFRKSQVPAEFAIPMQGLYAGVLSPQATAAWHQLR